MKSLATVLSLAAAFAPGLAVAQHAHGTHEGHGEHQAHATHAGHAAAAAADNAGQSAWAPDAPLVAGMARVRNAVATLAHLEMGHLDERQVLALAEGIDVAIEDMHANSSLEPEPEAALHGILARLKAATQALRDVPADPASVAAMRAALADYVRLFDDPAASAER